MVDQRTQDLQQAEEDLRYRLNFERLITRIVSDFVDLEPDEVDAGVNHALELVGLFAGVDRAYVFLMRDERSADNTHEWCAPDVAPQAHRLQGLEIDAVLPWFAAQIRRLEVFHVPRVSDLPAAARAERAEFEAESIQSLLVVPMSHAGRLVGFLGFDAVRSEKVWSEDCVTLLRILGDVITTALERRRADRARRESDDRFRAPVQNLVDGIIVTDSTGGVAYESPSAAVVLGRDPGSLVGRPIGELIAELIHPDDRATVERALAAAIGGVSTLAEYRIRQANGSYRDVESVAANLLEHPAVRGMVVILRDITERKRAEAERRALEAKIQQTQKLESLGILAGGIAHDFNNLLTGILGNASLALAVLPPSAPARESVELVERAALRAAELTEQMLAYSGRGRFVVQLVQLSGVVEEMSHLLSASIPKKCVLRYEFAAQLPAVEADVAQLRQVVMNLIINAAEAMGGESGVITVRTGARLCDATSLADGPVHDLPPGACVFLEVSDTGCGMSAAVRARIFEPFFATKFTGRGLGLAAVLGIVRGHHGAIQVQSEPGQGTTVRVLLPAAGKMQAAAVRREASEWRGGGTVLVIDDEEIVRVLARRILERAGFKVLTANDGRQGVELFAAHADEICAVLLDLTMPHLDGAETFRELRRLHLSVPVILSSGFSEQDAMTRFAETGIAGFVQKPYSVAKLTEVVRNALDPGAEAGDNAAKHDKT